MSVSCPKSGVRQEIASAEAVPTADANERLVGRVESIRASAS